MLQLDVMRVIQIDSRAQQLEAQTLTAISCWVEKWFIAFVSIFINLYNYLYINYQLDALIIIYSKNNIPLHMFRASSAHLQEDTVVHMQHMVLSLCKQVSVV